MNDERGLSKRAVMERMGVGYVQLMRWINSGKLRTVQQGNRLVIPRWELIRFQQHEMEQPETIATSLIGDRS